MNLDELTDLSVFIQPMFGHAKGEKLEQLDKTMFCCCFVDFPFSFSLFFIYLLTFFHSICITLVFMLYCCKFPALMRFSCDYLPVLVSPKGTQ